MKTYEVICSWAMSATVTIEAEDEEEATQIAIDSPLPLDGSYLPISFQVDQCEEA